MIAKMTHSDILDKEGYDTVAITLLSGKTVNKRVDDDLYLIVNTHRYISISDHSQDGFRKYRLHPNNKTGAASGYFINSHRRVGDAIFVCKKGLKAIGFKNTDYVYVKFGRKV